MAAGDNYNLVERLLHYLAFSTPMVQKVLYELENDLYGSKFRKLRSDNEVFVTGLPRSGTTLLLNLLHGTGEFTTFTYRNMPFVLSPLIWAKISGLFQKPAQKKQRAHGDGMEVSFDSPEAFEEIIWLTYLKDEIVKPSSLSPLSLDMRTGEIAEVFKTTIKKLIYLKTLDSNNEFQNRYLSKNNANISRLPVISRLFPRAKVIIPFRQPLAHVSSLMKQHELFTQRHTDDKFSQRYMEWLGHYEFGANFRPIDFDQWLSPDNGPTKIDNDFWLRYWTAAYDFVLKNMSSDMCLVDFDKLLDEPVSSLERIADYVELRDKTKLIAEAQSLRAPTTRPLNSDLFLPMNRDAALAVYEQLTSRSFFL